MDLPDINNEPKHYADYCLSLSTTLINSLTKVFQDRPDHGLVLSIGSGSGLLEAILLAQWAKDPHCNMEIEGVEVYSTAPVNRYLPEEAITTVAGTWDLSPRIADASALLFIYPRQPVLLTKCIDLVVREEHSVEVIVWLGPRADWDDYEPCFSYVLGFKAVEEVHNCGLVEYEMMVMLQRHHS